MNQSSSVERKTLLHRQGSKEAGQMGFVTKQTRDEGSGREEE